MGGDNLSIDICAEGRDALAHALAIVWDACPGGRATHYMDSKVITKTVYHSHELRNGLVANLDLHRETPAQMHVGHYDRTTIDEDGIQTLILMWSKGEGDSSDVRKLPYALTLDKVVSFVYDWLGEIEYPPEPDHDGGNHKGFRAFTDYWGHVAGNGYAIVGIQPNWAMYGK